MPIEKPYYPIIYIRGYAATMGEIEETVATPYMGFNLGSTKIRQNYNNDIVRFIFESPLIRLMKDEGYVDAYKNGDFIPENEEISSKSIWIFRYYEKDSESLGSGEKSEIEEFAKDLGAFIERIKRQVCRGNPADEDKFKVYLVAHSMGGLICRCYLQNIARNNHVVDKVFTYATPHRGIDILGINAPDIGSLDRLHVKNFNRDYMRQYLKITDKNTPVNSLDNAFPKERFFSFIGTNYKDYEAFLGLSKHGTGPTSDGLVMMRNAWVDGSPRAFAYRSHSGHYGIVNSEEGYQNLRRFLFGQVRVDALLEADEITLPPKVQKEKQKGKDIKAQYNIDVAVKVRGAQCYLTERRVVQESAIRKPYDDLIKKKKPVYLTTGYLHRSAKTRARDAALAFAIQIRIEVPVFEVNKRFWFDEHFEGENILDETITIHLRRRGGKPTIRYGLKSAIGTGNATRAATIIGPDSKGIIKVEIPLGFKAGAARPPRPGFRGRLILRASPWS